MTFAQLATQRWATAIALTAAAFTWVAGPRPAIATETVLYPRIVNGRTTTAYPAIGALLLYDDANASNLSGLCSGTLIGCRTFLTAAHCVCPDAATDAATCEHQGLADPATLRIFLQQGGIFATASVRISPDYSFAERGDVAVITLRDAVQGITPSPLNTISSLPLGTVGTIIGFGTTAAGRRSPNDSGVKREGVVTTAQCPSDIPSDSQLCWTFLGGGSNTCEGDSGGPMLADFGSGPVLAGVTSGGSSFDCLAPDLGFDSDVFVNRAWISAAAGDDLGTESCGLVATTGASTATSTSAGQLDASTPEASLQFDVPAGTAVLRIGLNGQLANGTGFLSSPNDFDLLVRAGSAPPTLDAFDCADTNSTPFGFCEISAPQPGTWHAVVQLRGGAGAFQLTATTFASTVACTGDCNGDGVVTVDEVLEGVSMSLGSTAVMACPRFDANGDGLVTIDEVLAGVTSALSGCPRS